MLSVLLLPCILNNYTSSIKIISLIRRGICEDNLIWIIHCVSTVSDKFPLFSRTFFCNYVFLSLLRACARSSLSSYRFTVFIFSSPFACRFPSVLFELFVPMNSYSIKYRWIHYVPAHKTKIYNFLRRESSLQGFSSDAFSKQGWKTVLQKHFLC